MWETIFGLANLVAMLAWVVLILGPRGPIVLQALFFGPLLMLAATYATCLALVLSGVIPTTGGADFTSIAGVRSIFASDAGATIGWIHYLAFDLFIGIWIVRNTERQGLSGLKGRLIQAPILLATFIAGPFGLTLYILIRQLMFSRKLDALVPA